MICCKCRDPFAIEIGLYSPGFLGESTLGSITVLLPRKFSGGFPLKRTPFRIMATSEVPVPRMCAFLTPSGPSLVSLRVLTSAFVSWSETGSSRLTNSGPTGTAGRSSRMTGASIIPLQNSNMSALFGSPSPASLRHLPVRHSSAARPLFRLYSVCFRPYCLLRMAFRPSGLRGRPTSGGRLSGTVRAMEARHAVTSMWNLSISIDMRAAVIPRACLAAKVIPSSSSRDLAQFEIASLQASTAGSAGIGKFPCSGPGARSPSLTGTPTTDTVRRRAPRRAGATASSAARTSATGSRLRTRTIYSIWAESDFRSSHRQNFNSVTVRRHFVYKYQQWTCSNRRIGATKLKGKRYQQTATTHVYN